MKQVTPQAKRAMAANSFQLTTVRHVSAILSGTVAGVCGCESWLGGAFFFVAAALISPTVYVITLHVMTLLHDRSLRKLGTQLAPERHVTDINFTIKRFYPGLPYIYLSQITTGILSFILTWTLVYNLVHVFK